MGDVRDGVNDEFRLHLEQDQVCGESAVFHLQFVCEAVPKGTRRVVISMSDVDQLDSGGIAALIRMRAEMRRRGCGVRLANLRCSVASQLGQIGLRELFRVD